MTPSGPDYLVTLVRGTWAEDARWCRPGSQLRTDLRAQLDGSVEFDDKFGWSGRNSHLARRIAGVRLALRLRKNQELHPRQFVVAHSHGGNVAIYAARKVELPSLKGIVCLATPFLRCERRGKQLTRAIEMSLFMSGLGLLAWALILLYHLKVSLLLCVVLVVAYLFVAAALGIRVEKLQSQVSAADFETGPNETTPVLALQLSGDEVQLWLRLVTGLSELPQHLLNLSEWFLHRSRVITLAVLGLLGFLLGTYLSEVAGIKEEWAVLPVGIFIGCVLGAGYLPLPILVGSWLVAKMTRGSQLYGLGESLKTSVLLRTIVWDGNAKYRPPSGRGLAPGNPLLRHSRICSDPGVIADISGWVRRGCVKEEPSLNGESLTKVH